MAVYVAAAIVVLCAWVIFVVGFRGFRPGGDGVDVEEDVYDWMRLVLFVFVCEWWWAG